jgi:SAM-dependent methyltransferase
VAFVQGDLRQLAFDAPFDAVVGRYVLLYLGDPAEALRRLSSCLHPGGIVAFLEPDFSNLIAVPASPTYVKIRDWWHQTARAAGLHLNMGLELYQVFQAAGLPAPTLQGDTPIGGGPDFSGYSYLANVIRSILPLMERFGVATAGEVGIGTLANRLRDDVVRGGGCLALQLTVGAYARKR